jgi:formylglycine-generating enzyme required for sulfatase activity
MKWGKIILIVFGSLVLTALGIDAADTLQGSKGTLLSQVISKNGEGPCPAGMAHVVNIPSITCVDLYEASTGENCPVSDPEQIVSTQRNLETKECIAESKKEDLPWRFISRDQALNMCARSGKRLPTSEEWYAIALGMSEVEKTCNVSSKSVSKTGAHIDCVSPHGAYDLVGNAWEWVGDDVINGMYKANRLPQSGYVAQTDVGGMTTVVSENPDDLFGKDYFWSEHDGAFGIIRGGYYDSGTDAGLYTIHADTPPTTASIGIGFRCVK